MESRNAKRFVLAFLLTAAAILGPVAAFNLSSYLGGDLWPPSDVEHNRLGPAYRAPTPGESLIYWKYRGLIRDPGVWKADIVLFGDSSCAMSVIPAVIETETGRRTVNLGLDGSYSLDFNAKIFEDYVQRIGPPRIAVLHLSASSTIGVADSRQTSAYSTIERRRAAGFRWVETVLGHAPAAYKAGLDLSFASLWSILRRDDTPSPALGQFPPDAEIGRILRETSGFLRNNAQPKQLETASFVPQLSRYNRPKLLHVFEFTAEHDIPLLVVLNPMPESFKNSETVEGFGSFEATLADLARPFRGVRIAHPLLRFFPDDVAFDGAHMIGLGPETNSEQIVRYISDDPDVTAWMESWSRPEITGGGRTTR
jgi:hypothetical protein